MSHTTTINCVKITDPAALKSAITELKSQGVPCDLLEDAAPRGYYRDQLQKAPIVMRFTDGRYDVGFYRENDGTYTAKCDFWNREIERHLGVQDDTEGVTPDQKRLGRLFNAYAVHATIRKATQQGYQVQRVPQKDGGIQLRLTQAAA